MIFDITVIIESCFAIEFIEQILWILAKRVDKKDERKAKQDRKKKKKMKRKSKRYVFERRLSASCDGRRACIM